MTVDDDAYVAREYASLDRLQLRRLDRTGWLRFDDLDEEQTLLAALAEVALVIARAKDARAAVRTCQAAVDELLDGLFGPVA